MKPSIAAFALFCIINLSPAVAAPPPWHTLTPAQQEALAPLVQQWSGLSEEQQRSLLVVAKHYPDLKPAEKQRATEPEEQAV